MKLEVVVFIDHLLSKIKKDKENTILPDTKSGIAKGRVKVLDYFDELSGAFKKLAGDKNIFAMLFQLFAFIRQCIVTLTLKIFHYATQKLHTQQQPHFGQPGFFKQ